MASLFPSVTHQTSLMLTATAQRQRMVAVCICFLVLAGGSAARFQFEELQSGGNEEFVMYLQGDRVPHGLTIVTSASLSGRNDTEFGDIVTISDFIREGFAKDSTPLGFGKGLRVLERGLSNFVTIVYEFTTPGRSGTLTAQGVLNSDGRGELAITGGTGTYRWARGYIDVVPVSPDPAAQTFNDTVHLNYFVTLSTMGRSE